ncbi:MAG: GYD domain-containing protein [Acidimicrobiia bacterium]|nr:GYD domain-containing protein [Acidimicrobiia bacterium]
MAKYLVKGNYVGNGIAGLLQDGGTARRDAATAAIESLGGTVESFYFAFGDTDVIAILDVPDEASAIALSLLINASGAVSLSLTPLISPETVDAASKLSPSYRPPGG